MHEVLVADGFSRPVKELIAKMKKLQATYRQEKNSLGTGSSPSKWEYFNSMHAFMSTSHIVSAETSESLTDPPIENESETQETPQPHSLIVIEFDEDAVDIQNIGDDDDTSNSVPSFESSMPNAAEASEANKAKNVPKPRKRKKAKSSLDEVIDILKADQATNSAVGQAMMKTFEAMVPLMSSLKNSLESQHSSSFVTPFPTYGYGNQRVIPIDPTLLTAYMSGNAPEQEKQST